MFKVRITSWDKELYSFLSQHDYPTTVFGVKTMIGQPRDRKV